MSQILRRFVFATLVACHAAVVLCGPCLHELPGSTHRMGAASNPDRPDHPLQSQSDSKDRCLICQFVAQGQLPVEFYVSSSPELVAELVLPPVSAPHLPFRLLPSSPRAPPVCLCGLS
jgi:hypothetical protein